ncbi:putative ATP-dependent RNA helicase DHX37 isoform X2, partial [Brachionus plicatilis]
MVKKSKPKSKQDAESPEIKVDLDQIGLSKNDQFTNQMQNDSNMLIIDGNKPKKTELDDKKQEPKKRQLSKKERKKLEKVLERKNKSSKREELLEKLASIQVNSNELKLYSSVRDIGQKEKRKLIDKPDESEARTVNSISGSNKRKKSEDSPDQPESTDTDDVSSDSDIDEDGLQKALEQYKKNQETERARIAEINMEKFKPTKIVDSEDEEFQKEENASQAANKRNTKYVHVERRDEIKECRSKLPIISEEQ